jgi:hypothetical protein
MSEKLGIWHLQTCSCDALENCSPPRHAPVHAVQLACLSTLQDTKQESSIQTSRRTQRGFMQESMAFKVLLRGSWLKLSRRYEFLCATSQLCPRQQRESSFSLFSLHILGFSHPLYILGISNPFQILGFSHPLAQPFLCTSLALQSLHGFS